MTGRTSRWNCWLRRRGAGSRRPGAVRRRVDEFTLRSPEPLSLEQRNVVRQASVDLIGLEVVAGDERRITLRCLLDTSDVSIRQTTIQLQLVALSMQENAVAALSADLDALDRERYDDDTEDAYLLGVALDSVRRTAEYGGNVAEIMIQSAARNGEL